MPAKRTCQDNCSSPGSHFPSFAPNWRRICTNSKNSIPDMLVIFFCLKIPTNVILCVRVVSNQLCNASGPPPQVQCEELATRLSFRQTVEFLQAVEFVLWETLVQSVEVKAVKELPNSKDVM